MTFDEQSILQNQASQLATKNSLIGAGLNLGGALVQQAFAGRNMRMQNKYSKDLLQFQWDNSTPSQVNALKKAGLNVGLMYSNGGPSVSGSTGSTGMPQISNPMNGVADLMLSSQRAEADIENTKQHTEVLKQQVINDRLKQISIELQNAREQMQNERFKKDAEARYNALLAEEKALMAQAKKNIAEAESEDATRQGKVGELESRIGLNNAQRDQIIEMMPLEKDLKRSLKYMNDATARREDSQVPVNEILVGYYKAGAHKFNAEQRLVIASAIQKEFETQYAKEHGYSLAPGMSGKLASCLDWLIGNEQHMQALLGDKASAINMLDSFLDNREQAEMLYKFLTAKSKQKGGTAVTTPPAPRTLVKP